VNPSVVQIRWLRAASNRKAVNPDVFSSFGEYEIR